MLPLAALWIGEFQATVGALETHIAATGAGLTEAQVETLATKVNDDVAYGKIETA